MSNDNKGNKMKIRVKGQQSINIKNKLQHLPVFRGMKKASFFLLLIFSLNNLKPIQIIFYKVVIETHYNRKINNKLFYILFSLIWIFCQTYQGIARILHFIITLYHKNYLYWCHNNLAYIVRHMIRQKHTK